MSEMTVVVKERTERGKNASRRMREAGDIPAVVYGADKPTVSITVDRRAMSDLIRQSGEHAVFLLKLGDSGKSRHAMIRDMQIDPISRTIQHIDFQRVLMDEAVKVEVPVELVGTPEGVKNQGGVLDFVTREVLIESLPGDIPAHLQLDVSDLEVGHHLVAGDLELPVGVQLAGEPSQVVVSISHSRVAAEVAEAEAEAEAAESGLIEAAPEEPEVIGRAKAEEQEGSEDED